MTSITFRQLIDLAIGTPEPGHVNFFALHCLLCSFAEKLNCSEHLVDCSQLGKYAAMMVARTTNGGEIDEEMTAGEVLPTKFSSLLRCIDMRGVRIAGGADAEVTELPAEETEIAESDTEKGKEMEKRSASVAEPQADAVSVRASNVSRTERASKAAASVADAISLRASTVSKTERASKVERDSKAERSSKKSSGGSPRVSAASSPGEIKTVAARTSDNGFMNAMLQTAGSKELQDAFQNAFRGTIQSSIIKMDQRISGIETYVRMPMYDIQKGVSVMKEQLEMAMEQLLLMAQMIMSEERSATRMDQLRQIARRLRTIQNNNVYIEPVYRSDHSEEEEASFTEPSFRDYLDECDYDPDASLDARIESCSASKSASSFTLSPCTSLNLPTHIEIPQQKVVDQLVDVKADLCRIRNKVNELGQAILNVDCMNTKDALDDIFEQLKELRAINDEMKETNELNDQRILRQFGKVEEIAQGLDEVRNIKMDKLEMEIMLADKVDYTQLQRKATHDDVSKVQCLLETRLCEMNKSLKNTERSLVHLMDDLRETLGVEAVTELLNKFKESMHMEIKNIAEALQKYVDATNDECAAAGGRFKVLQDLACISCDTPCVMRAKEKHAVGKLRDAHASPIISPLVTYELGSIRKSGTMGYIRKDDFPHSQDAWMKNQTSGMKTCIPRHAGGSHTKFTAKEHVEKVLQRKC